MLADFVVETCSTTGTSTYSLGGAQSPYRRFRDAFITGAKVRYVAKTVAASPTPKIEGGIGTLTTGSPDTLARTSVRFSSNANAAVDWQSSDIYWIYVAPDLEAMEPLPHDWKDTATSGATVDASHKGTVIECDVTAANRAVTLPAISGLTDIYFRFGVYGYGSTANSVVLTPASGDAINEGAANATLSILGGVLTFVHFDPVKSKWRTR